MALPALALPGRNALPLPSSRQLSDKSGLLELRDGPQDLKDQNSSRCVLKEECWRRRGNKGNPLRLQHVVAGELDDEIAGEAVRALDNDGPRAIGQQAFQHLVLSNANLDLCTSDVVTEEPQMRRRTFLAGSAAAALATGGEGNAQQAQDATGELNFVVTRRVQAGKEEEVEAILRDLQATTLANDKDCLRYEWYRASTPQTYMLLESWADQAAAQEHLKAPHVVTALEKLLSLVAEPPQAVRLTKLAR